MAKGEVKTKKKCCHKFIQKGKHCSKCPIVGDASLLEKVIGEKKKKKKKKSQKKRDNK